MEKRVKNSTDRKFMRREIAQFNIPLQANTELVGGTKECGLPLFFNNKSKLKYIAMFKVWCDCGMVVYAVFQRHNFLCYSIFIGIPK